MEVEKRNRKILVISIIESDDGRYVCQVGDLMEVPLNLHSLVEFIQNVILSAFGKCGKNPPQNISKPMDN